MVKETERDKEKVYQCRECKLFVKNLDVTKYSFNDK